MTSSAAVLSVAARLLAAFEAAGAARVETDILQPSDVLLDLYGEDVRGRAFVTQDPSRGEMMLRPDFTVPVARHHLAGSGGSATYTYSGTVFRQPPDGVDRPAEYVQVGYEVIGAPDSVRADADLFAQFHAMLAPAALDVATGDISLLTAAIGGLRVTEARRAALLRHLWRPQRFRALLERFSKPLPPAASSETDAPEIGLRTRDEVLARLSRLDAERAAPPLSKTEAEMMDALLSLRETSANSLSQLRDLAVDMPAIQPAVTRMAARLEALAARGIDAEGLPFEATYGRTSMEYYDGFVFGFLAPGRPDLPAVASGGRYDALTRALGGDAPAVGGVIRPGLLVELGLQT
ncbi:MAG: ATP phosphoribosyltransferase regulatory subunit, partial [Pseudomonadota bacterium]